MVSLFSGCGGSSLGYRWAGFRELLAVDFDKHAVGTFRLNFPDVPCWERDIRGVTAEEVLGFCGIGRGGLDVLDGSPPCQGFSTAGKRNVSDARNLLPWEFVRLVEGLRPRAFVMENVSGMVKGPMKGIFKELMRGLKATGYRVECRMLNAMWYGVPQSRERLVWIGMEDGRKIRWPERREIVTVGQAIGHLPVGEPGEHEPQVVDAWRRAKPGQSLRKAVRHVGSFQSCRLDPGRPAPTLIKAHNHWHHKVPRQLTVVEAGLIQSFPEGFQWTGRKGEILRRIGEAVPPRMMEAIAMSVREALDGPA